MMPGGVMGAGGLSPRPRPGHTNGYSGLVDEDDSDSKLKNKLKNSPAQHAAANYFKVRLPVISLNHRSCKLQFSRYCYVSCEYV